MARIDGTDGMTHAQLEEEARNGCRFVCYEYCISVLVLTFRRRSDVFFLRPGESALSKGLPYTVLSLFLGWWGFPWGLIYTPMALATNLRGGKDVTYEVLDALGRSASA
jgi:hypothetical protein